MLALLAQGNIKKNCNAFQEANKNKERLYKKT